MRITKGNVNSASFTPSFLSKVGSDFSIAGKYRLPNKQLIEFRECSIRDVDDINKRTKFELGYNLRPSVGLEGFAGYHDGKPVSFIVTLKDADIVAPYGAVIKEYEGNKIGRLVFLLSLIRCIQTKGAKRINVTTHVSGFRNDLKLLTPKFMASCGTECDMYLTINEGPYAKERLIAEILKYMMAKGYRKLS